MKPALRIESWQSCLGLIGERIFCSKQQKQWEKEGKIDLSKWLTRQWRLLIIMFSEHGMKRKGDTHNRSAHRSLSMKIDSWAVRDKRTKANSNYKMRSLFEWQIYTGRERNGEKTPKNELSIQLSAKVLSLETLIQLPTLTISLNVYFFCADCFRIRKANEINIKVIFLEFSPLRFGFVLAFVSMNTKIFDRIFDF